MISLPVQTGKPKSPVNKTTFEPGQKTCSAVWLKGNQSINIALE
jgi:hypothetical protein